MVCLNTEWLSCKFFLPTSSSPLPCFVRDVNVYLRSRRIHVWDMWRTYIGYAYVVYVWT